MNSKLLEKAINREDKRSTRGPRKRPVDFDEEIPVFMAYVLGDIPIGAGMEAYGYSSHSAFSYRMMLVLREGLKAGRIQVSALEE